MPVLQGSNGSTQAARTRPMRRQFQQYEEPSDEDTCGSEYEEYDEHQVGGSSDSYCSVSLPAVPHSAAPAHKSATGAGSNDVPTVAPTPFGVPRIDRSKITNTMIPMSATSGPGSGPFGLGGSVATFPPPRLRSKTPAH